MKKIIHISLLVIGILIALFGVIGLFTAPPLGIAFILIGALFMIPFVKSRKGTSAACVRCGKKGLFLQVNADGLCADCQRTVQLEQEYKKANEKLVEIRRELSDQETFRAGIIQQTRLEMAAELNQMREDASKQLKEDLNKKREELTEYTAKLESQKAKLEKAVAQQEKAEKAWKNASNKMERVKNLYNAMLYALKTYTDTPAEKQRFRLPYSFEEIDFLLEPTVSLKFHSTDLKDLRSRYKQIEKQIDETLDKYRSRYTTKANIAIYRLMVIALRAELQNVIYGLKYGKLDDAEAEIKEITAKYLQIATEGNQSIAPTMVKFVGELEYLFLEAVRIEYEYYVKKEQIKEEQRALREQMRQEAEERKRLEEQKKQVEKEESKYHTEIQSIREQLEAATEDDTKTAALQKRIEELQKQLAQVEEKKEEISRLQNGQAGYVYVISNLGSFGNDVFKVGMTRRLEPQERVDELGSASVPFPFDVHSFIFSSNAVQLENTMHKRLNEFRLNKVNLRKEFFKVPLDQMEELVQELDPTAEFNRTMLAEQYNQSLSIDEPAEEITDFNGDDDE